MATKLEKILNLETNVIAMEQELVKYHDMFLADGVIDDYEQEQLDTMFATINNVVEEIFQLKAALPPEIDKATFLAGKYKETNYSPPTGTGLFDVSLNPKSGRLEVLVKVNFTFEDGDAVDFNDLKGQSAIWSDAEIKKWKASYIALMEGRWGGKYHFHHPDLKNVTVYVDVEIDEKTSGWHYDLKINKIPKGEMEQSSVTHLGKRTGGVFKASKKTDKHSVDLDSEDLTFIDKGTDVKDKQKGAVHEFGHMVGLGDEYDDRKAGIKHAAMVRNALGTVLTEGNFDDVMSVGNTIEKQHYVTFLAALKKVTGLNKWQFKK